MYTGLGILDISTCRTWRSATMAGINQVLVNPKVGLNFAEALRS